MLDNCYFVPMKKAIFILLSFLVMLLYSCNKAEKTPSVFAPSKGRAIEGLRGMPRQVPAAVEDTVIKKLTQGDSAETSKAVVGRVKEIYDDVCRRYNRPNQMSPNRFDIERRFCSKAWQAESEEVRQIDKRHHGDLGLWDYDFWIQGQDWENVSYHGVKVVRAEDRTAYVRLVVHNMNDDAQIGLRLVKERGNWFIDDLTDENHPQGIRARQAEYIQENELRQANSL